jgi:KipI family sensor histidine kinase inhibitor
MTRRLIDYGPAAALLECENLAEVVGLLPQLREQPKINEVVPGARTALLRLTAPLDEADRRLLQALVPTGSEIYQQVRIRVEVDYSGEDLRTVADQVGTTPAGVVELHTGQTWTVGFCGFAPGFAYLQGEHDRLRVSRRQQPRPNVPAGAVGLADSWSGIYPRAGPGGWQLIGRTDAQLWDLNQTPPALLQPGFQVRFTPLAS